MRVFTDLDQFADAIAGIDGRFFPLAASEGEWSIAGRRLPRLSVQQVQVGAAAVFAGHGTDGQLTLGLPTSDPQAININGEPLDQHSFVLNRYRSPLIYSAKCPTTWLTVTLNGATDEDIRELIDIADKPPRPQQLADSVTLRRVGLLIRWCSRDHEFAGDLEPNAVVAAQDDLIAAISTMVLPPENGRRLLLGRPRIARERLIGRCLEFLRENESQPVLVTDLCRAAHVSQRTLRNCFVEYFGVGPRRLLNARQLDLIRRELLASSADTESVSSIAARYGVWDFSAFARNYRRMYRESPSETLHAARSREGSPQDGTEPLSWMTLAALCFRRDDSCVRM